MYNIELYQSSGKLSNLEKSTQKYKNDLDRLDNNIKKEYLKNLLSKFSKEEKSTIIYYNNQSFTLENFITIEIFKMMDREHYIHNETGKILFKEDGSYLSPLEFIRTIDKVVEGFANPDNLLYAPEIKFYSNKVIINEQFETNIKGLYSIGDGGGMTRGLMMASCSGIQMARNL